MARFWSSHYEWNAHRKHAAAAGLDPAVAEAIEIGKRPDKLSPDETLVYDLVTELLHNKDISDATFAAARERLGDQMLIELIGTVGYYGFISLVLNASRTPVAQGEKPLPAI